MAFASMSRLMSAWQVLVVGSSNSNASSNSRCQVPSAVTQSLRGLSRRVEFQELSACPRALANTGFARGPSGAAELVERRFRALDYAIALHESMRSSGM